MTCGYVYKGLKAYFCPLFMVFLSVYKRFPPTSRNPMTTTSAELTNASAALLSVSLTGELSVREAQFMQQSDSHATIRGTIKAAEKVG